MSTPAILLVNPNRMQPPIAPMGLEYAASALGRAGYCPVLCDLTFAEDWRETLSSALESVRPRAIAFSIRNLDDAYFASQDFILAGTKKMISLAIRASDAPVVLGGVGFCIAPAEVLRYTGAHYGVMGEAETGLPALLDALADGAALSDVPGAVYRQGDGVVVNPPRFADLAAMPTPSRRFVDNPRYFAEGGQAGVETKRGCNGACIYCVEPEAKGRAVRLRRPESVAEEFRDLIEQGIDTVHLCDSEFNMPRSHAAAVCEALIDAGLSSAVCWYAYCAPVPFDVELAQLMARAGCVGINFGADHADAGMLQRLGRPYGPGAIRAACEASRKVDMAVMFDMLFGAPGETRASMEQAITFMRGLDAGRVGLSCGARVYPNTRLARMVRDRGALADNPNLHGVTRDNEQMLRPLFYVESQVGGDIHAIVRELVDGDRRFLHADPGELEGSYNYNDNSVLARAIRAGARGAYWDILRKLEA